MKKRWDTGRQGAPRRAGRRARRRAGCKASEWFVEIDGGRTRPETDSAFAEWLRGDPNNADAFDRCQAAVLLTGQLRDRAGAQWMFDEARALAGAPGRRRANPFADTWLARPAVAWSITGLSLLIAAATLLIGVPPAITELPETTAEQTPGAGTIDLAGLTDSLAVSDPVVILPGEVVVDAQSVAILPFGAPVGAPVGQGASDPVEVDAAKEVAAALYEQVLQQLDRLPGVYVADKAAAEAYAGEDLPREQIAVQLGVRGIVEGDVSSGDGQLRVVVRMIDVYRGDRREQSFETPIGELAAMRTSIATNIAVALTEANAATGYER